MKIWSNLVFVQDEMAPRPQRVDGHTASARIDGVGRRLFAKRDVAALLYLIVPVFFVAMTLAKGVPALRHDWAWPIEPAAFHNSVLDWTSGWDVSGLGEPKPVTTYLFALPALAAAAIFGSAGALGLFLTLIGATMAFACARMSRHFTLSPISTAAIASLVVANPWVYAELVAGHLGMLLAYGCVVVLWTELLGAKFDRRRGIIALAGASFQPQLFVLAWVACWTRFREPGARAALACAAIIFSPYLFGIMSHWGSVAATPLTLSWERTQSVPFDQALLLRGYFAGYTHGFDGARGTIGLAIFALIAVAAAIFPGRGSIRGVGFVTAIMLFTAAGTQGPLAPLVSFGFIKIPAFGFFRELYDLIGIAAAGYAIAVAAMLARRPLLRWPALAAGALLLSVWFVTPPATFWVSSDSIPALEHDGATSSGRYALMPPIQPLSFRNGGSGIDPATFYRTLRSTPLNRDDVAFPTTNALVSFWQTGRTGELARLGTSQVFCRPDFATDEVRGGIRALRRSRVAKTCLRAGADIARPSPIVSLQNTARICNPCAVVGAGNLFDGDATAKIRRVLGLRGRAGTYDSLPPSRGGDDPGSEWIDARLAFASRPDIAQSFGGAYTTGQVRLPWHSATLALVNVRGRLVDQSGRAIAGDTSGYRWVAVPESTASLICFGECAIALQSNAEVVASEPAAVASTPLIWTPLAPWLLFVHVPAGRPQIVRYLESYDPWWVAIVNGHLAVHLRLDTAINGWILPHRARPQDIILLHAASALQIILELFAILAFVWGILRAPTTRADARVPFRGETDRNHNIGNRADGAKAKGANESA